MTVFVSHASRDTGLPLYDVLLGDLRTRSGQDVWVDSELAGGQKWWDEICTQIRGCSLFAVVVTPRLVKSDACRRELGYAVALGRPVLPVKITDVADWQLPELVARTQVLDFTTRRDPGEAGVECAFALSDAVRRLTAVPAVLPDPLPEQPDVPETYLSDLQRYLQAPDLSREDQERFVLSVRGHLDDEDKDAAELVAAVETFLKRPEIVHRVHSELVACLAQLDGRPGPVPERDVVGVTAEAASRPVPDPSIAVATDDVPPSAAAPASVALSGSPPAASVPAARQPEPATPAPGTWQQQPPPSPGAPPPLTNLRTARYPAPGLDRHRLADAVKGWFESQRLESQVQEDGPRLVVQCRSSSFARKVGAGTALTVLLSTDGDQLVVEVGGAKWVDKVAAAGVGALILWPALIPAAMGGYKQATLPKRTLSYIESMIPRCSV